MTNMNANDFLKAVDHAAGMNDRWLFLAAFCLLLIGGGVVIYWLVRQLQTVLADQVLRVEFDSGGFTLIQGTPVGGGFQVTWASVPGKRYTVYCATNLASGALLAAPLKTNLLADGAILRYQRLGDAVGYLDLIRIRHDAAQEIVRAPRDICYQSCQKSAGHNH